MSTFILKWMSLSELLHMFFKCIFSTARGVSRLSKCTSTTHFTGHAQKKISYPSRMNQNSSSGADPEKQNAMNFGGPDSREFIELRDWLFSSGNTKSYQKKGFQHVLNPTPLNPSPATCHMRKRKLHCNFRNAALQKLHCNIGCSAVQMSF